MSKHDPDIETPSLLITAIDEMSRVRDNPRVLVIIAQGFIELMINTMIDVKCKHGKQINDDRHSYTYATKLLILNELNVLSDHHFRLLKWFNKLRNDFAHDPRVKLTADRLSVFSKPAHRNIAKFDQLCAKIIADLWMNHLFDIGHVFMPGVIDRSQWREDIHEQPSPLYTIPLKADPKTIRTVVRGGIIRGTTPQPILKQLEDGDGSH